MTLTHAWRIRTARALTTLAVLDAWCCAAHLRAHGDVVIANASPVLVAGTLSGSPADSPAARVDPNTTSSPYAGVGSVRVNFSPNTYLGTGAAFSPLHILTAAHMFDLNNDGTIDVAPADVIFNLNFGGNLTHSIPAAALAIHPDWTGFSNPIGNIQDDIAVITLSAPLPSGVPIYPLYTSPVTLGSTFVHVGYGGSGDGATSSLTVGGSFSVKRTGMNNADLFQSDDEGGGAFELYAFDFDGPTSATNLIGSLTLGNDRETTLGGGDSGGPAFIDDGGVLKIAGNNTFVSSFIISTNPQVLGPAPPLFGSGGGGMLIYPYLDFLLPYQQSVPEAGSFLLVAAAALATHAGRTLLRRRQAARAV